MADRRALIAAGGTGGHFYPGFVLAQELRSRGWHPLLVVRRNDPARKDIETSGLASVELDLRGLPRSFGAELALFPFRLASACAMARRIVRDFDPAGVFGMGGYLTAPCAAAAALRGLPSLVHESNAVLGLANRVGAALGAKLYWGLPPASGAGEVVGTPIRPSLWKPLDAREARRHLDLREDLPTILVFGGSQGARGLNREAPAVLRNAAKRGALQVIHLSGAADAESMAGAYGDLPARVAWYLERMEWAYGAADLVICRAGASTIAELAAQKKAAVLVPFPSAAGNHQELNARAVAARGAAEVVLEKDLASRLPGLLEDLVFSKDAAAKRAAMSAAWTKLGLPKPEETPKRLADAFEAAVK